MTRADWTEELVSLLTELWEHTNLSAAKIGIRLGVSKDAVIGKVHRLKLKRRAPSPPKRPSRLFCRRGHPMNEENTVFRKDGTRHCRACHRQTALLHYHRTKKLKREVNADYRKWKAA